MLAPQLPADKNCRPCLFVIQQRHRQKEKDGTRLNLKYKVKHNPRRSELLIFLVPLIEK
jgi:hypothetical protein